MDITGNSSSKYQFSITVITRMVIILIISLLALLLFKIIENDVGCRTGLLNKPELGAWTDTEEKLIIITKEIIQGAATTYINELLTFWNHLDLASFSFERNASLRFSLSSLSYPEEKYC
jgi:hypothetical protein